jgi:uncharacterized protein
LSQIPASIRSEILHRIDAAEREHSVRILYAIESGSRSWGFASPNSDYDARFVYVHPRDWYLSVDLEEKRDVIEYKIIDEIDINGWDLRKALRLFAKSNPAFIEWIQSPIVYRDPFDFAQRCRDVLPMIYNCERGSYHYRSMAKTNYRGYLRADLVPLKKYFYVLRPLLSVRWIEAYQTAPPIEFAKLLHLISDRRDLLAAIDELLDRKKHAPEMGLAAQVPTIHSFIEQELERLETFVVTPTTALGNISLLNELFAHYLVVDE